MKSLFGAEIRVTEIRQASKISPSNGEIVHACRISVTCVSGAKDFSCNTEVF